MMQQRGESSASEKQCRAGIKHRPLIGNLTGGDCCQAGRLQGHTGAHYTWEEKQRALQAQESLWREAREARPAEADEEVFLRVQLTTAGGSGERVLESREAAEKQRLDQITEALKHYAWQELGLYSESNKEPIHNFTKKKNWTGTLERSSKWIHVYVWLSPFTVHLKLPR